MVCLAKQKVIKLKMARVKGRNMSLREAMQEYLSNKNIKQVVFDYILPIYFVIRR